MPLSLKENIIHINYCINNFLCIIDSISVYDYDNILSLTAYNFFAGMYLMLL